MDNEDRNKTRDSIKQHRLANGVHWSQPATSIKPGVSRAPGLDLMPGAGLGHSSNTARFNPTNHLGFGTTVAPLVQRSKEPQQNGRAPKRARLSGPTEQTASRFGYSDTQLSLALERSALPPLMQGSSSGAATHQKVEQRGRSSMASGNDSDDPIDAFAEDDKTAQRRNGTPSGTTTFQSIDRIRAQYERPIYTPQLPPKAPFLKPAKRIANMKDKDGKQRVDLKPQRSKKPTPSFTGLTDPLSQSSFPRKSPRKTESKYLEGSLAPSHRLQIKGMFIGDKRYQAVKDAYVDFDSTSGGSLTLHLVQDAEEVKISNRDIDWMETDFSVYIYICTMKGGKVERILEDKKLWVPRPLNSEFPLRTISLQFFDQGDLETSYISGILHGLKPRRPPPAEVSKMGCAKLWRNLSNGRASKKSEEKEPFDGSELSEPSPSPKREPPATRATISTGNATRKSTRVTEAAKPDLENDEIMLVYPFTGTGSTQITHGEHARLQTDQYLNDTLIEFGLRYWLEGLKTTNATLAKQIHVFSPFFFKKLKHKDPQTGYNAVKKWTSKVDIFQKRYLVVPINERLHWYLAIVLFPDKLFHAVQAKQQQSHTISSETQHEIPLESHLLQQDVDQPILPEIVAETPYSSLPASRAASPQDVQMNEDAEMGEEADFAPGSDHASSPGAPAVEEELLDVGGDEEPPDEGWKTSMDNTWLLSFDSLGGKHPAALKTIREYLLLELKHKKGIEFDNEISIMQKKVPSPVQPNFCDCGVYLIKTAEMFLEHSDQFLQRLMDTKDKLTENHSLWDPEAFPAKREQLWATVMALAGEWKIFKEKAGAEKAPVPANPKSIDPPEQHKEPLFTEEEDEGDDDIEFVGENPAPKGRAPPRPTPRRGIRHTKRIIS